MAVLRAKADAPKRGEHDEKAQFATQSIASTDVVDEKGDVGLATSNTYPLKIQLDLGETQIRSRTSWWKIWYVYKLPLLCINKHSPYFHFQDTQRNSFCPAGFTR